MSLATRLFTRPLDVTTRTEDVSGVEPELVDGATVRVLGALWESSSRDEQADGSVVRSEASAMLPAGTVVDTDASIVDVTTGQAWQVDGQPNHVWNARTASVSHIEVKLRRGV
ncbi:MAG: hypothetical protein AAGA99_21105 [Actinomycetota bacterium]